MYACFVVATFGLAFLTVFMTNWPSMEERWLHGAACHGCALVAETSCEMRNDYLDRALSSAGPPARSRSGRGRDSRRPG
jgi:hypothetical protein